MTLEGAVRQAMACCINMSEPVVPQYFWLTVQMLDDVKLAASRSPGHPHAD